MNHTQTNAIMQRWYVLQHGIIPEYQAEHGTLTPKLETLIHILDWIRIEEIKQWNWQGNGRIPYDRGALANAFIAKAVLGLSTTRALIERLTIDKVLKRICGFSMWHRPPNESTFSRAFAEFAASKLADKVHQAMVTGYLGHKLIGHISRDSTAIVSREKPLPKTESKPKPVQACKPKTTVIGQQLKQALPNILEALPKPCDWGTKRNAKACKTTWSGYKLHIDSSDCGVPISVILTSASVHDSQVAVPLAIMSSQRVTSCYDLMDAAYCSEELREHSRSLGHVPLIDHNPRSGQKKPFAPHEAMRYKERSQAERTNARLKDEFGANHLRVRGHDKVMAHLMFGVLALTADALIRLFC